MKHFVTHQWVTCIATIVSVVAILVPDLAFTQTTNGLFWGDGDNVNYGPKKASDINGGGDLYYKLVGDTFYVAFVTDTSRNDLVFSKKNDAYTQSVGWDKHAFDELKGSDNITWRFSCDGNTYEWQQDLLYDAGAGSGPEGRLWKSDRFGGDGSVGTSPGTIGKEASSLSWNMMNTKWTFPQSPVGGSGAFVSLKESDSPWVVGNPNFPAKNYPFFDPDTLWEWHIVYEFNFHRSICNGKSPSVWVVAAHRSPPKIPGLTTTLPVELVAFTALQHGGDIVLEWSTASESNNAGFAVEQSMDQGPFEEIAFVPGTGTTLEPQHYAYRVNSVEPGIHRFRLRQIDLDGAFEVLSTVEVSVELPLSHLLESAYPNPFNPQTTIRFAVRERKPVTMGLHDATGRLIRYLYEGTPEPNQMHTVSIDGTSLSSGIYIVRLSGQNFVANQSIALVK